MAAHLGTRARPSGCPKLTIPSTNLQTHGWARLGERAESGQHVPLLPGLALFSLWSSPSPWSPSDPLPVSQAAAHSHSSPEPGCSQKPPLSLPRTSAGPPPAPLPNCLPLTELLHHLSVSADTLCLVSGGAASISGGGGARVCACMRVCVR